MTTISRVAALTFFPRWITRETVAGDTPARLATSFFVANSYPLNSWEKEGDKPVGAISENDTWYRFHSHKHYKETLVGCQAFNVRSSPAVSPPVACAWSRAFYPRMRHRMAPPTGTKKEPIMVATILLTFPDGKNRVQVKSSFSCTVRDRVCAASRDPSCHQKQPIRCR